MTVKIIYLLDRNVVNIIKTYCNGNQMRFDGKDNAHKKEMLEFLKTIDTKENAISPLFSIVEGQKGRQENTEEKENCLEKEATAINSFFKNAKTDGLFLKNSKETVAELFSKPIEETWDRDALFLKEALPKICKVVAPKNKENVKNEIVKIAKKYKIGLLEIPVIVCLACLYESNNIHTEEMKKLLRYLIENKHLLSQSQTEYSSNTGPSNLNNMEDNNIRKILKPKPNYDDDKIIYNVLTDLYIISRKVLIKKALKEKKSTCNIKFLTLDKGLENLLEKIDVSVGEDNTDTFIYCRSLFLSLSDEQYSQLMNEIKTGY